MYYVYVLQGDVDNNLYTGSTPDLKKRFAKHCNGQVKSTPLESSGGALDLYPRCTFFTPPKGRSFLSNGVNKRTQALEADILRSLFGKR